MEITKKRLAPMQAASSDDTRYNLRSVYFDADGSLVATDGHILARVVPRDADIEAKPEAFLLDAASVKLLAASVAKKGQSTPLDVDETNRNGVASFGTLSLPKKADFEFPKWRQVHSRPDDVNTIVEFGLGVEVLERLLKTLKQFSGPGQDAHFMRIRVKDPMSPIYVEATDKATGDTLECSVMPARIQ